MAYTYTAFGDVDLPIYNIEQDLSVGEVDSSLLKTANGRAVDYLGTQQRLPGSQQIPIKGIYHEDVSLLVDESNNFIADESGNTFISGASGNTLRAQIDALRSAVGTVQKLYRQDLDTGDLRWKLCRLLSVPQPKTYRDRGVIAHVSALFDTAQPRWRAETITTTSESLSPGSTTVTVDSLGTDPVDDAIITITADGGAVTSVRIVLNNADFSWAGTLADGDELVINCGALTIQNDGVDAYGDFTLAAGHALDGWLRLLAESNEIGVTVDAACDITVEHYDQWT